MPRFALAVLLLLSGPGSWAQQGVSSSAEAQPADKETRLKALAALLESFTDEEYEAALAMVPEKKAESASLASRGAALKSAYTTLASVEYRKAVDSAPEEASAAYSAALGRVAGPGGAGSPAEAGLVVDVLKFLGNAALNYWLKGGTDFIDKGQRSGVLAQSQSDTELASASITPERKAELHFQKGQAYEAAAAAIAPETGDERAAKEKERLKELAALLQSMTDEEYAEAISALPEKAARAPQLASRADVLDSTYMTLAALEYRDAAADTVAPEEAGASYTADYDRVTRDEGSNLAVDPKTNKKSHWLRNLLGIAAVGGIGYLVYDNQRIKKKARRQVAEAEARARAKQGEVECPAGTRLESGRCIGELTCPPKTTRSGDQCIGERTCPAGTSPVGSACVADRTCPARSRRVGDDCVGDIFCPTGTRLSENRCVGEKVCPPRTTASGGRCIGDIDCPGATRLVGGECRGEPVCPGRTRFVAGECRGEPVCPGKTQFVVGECRGSLVCPPGAALRGDVCVAPLACPPPSRLEQDRCIAPLACLPPSRLEGGQCIAPLACRAPSVLSGNACIGQPQCPPGTAWSGSACMGGVVCPANTRPMPGNRCEGALVCPSGTQAHGSQCVGSQKCPPGQVLHLDNPKLMLCVACSLGERLLHGRCVPCNQSPWGCQNNIHNVSRAVDLHISAESVEETLASASLDPARRSQLRHLLGEIYEDLAGDARDAVAAQPAAQRAPQASDPGLAPARTAREPRAKTGAGLVAAGVHDVMLLKDGSRLEGEVTAASPDKIVLKTGRGVVGVGQGRIKALVLRGAEADVDAEVLRASEGTLPLVLMNDGTSFRGKMASASARQMVFKMEDGVTTFQRGDVRAVVFPDGTDR